VRNDFLRATKAAHFGALGLALVLAACGEDGGGAETPRDPAGDVRPDGGSGRDGGKGDAGKRDAAAAPSDEDDDDDEPTGGDADDGSSDVRDAGKSDAGRSDAGGNAGRNDAGSNPGGSDAGAASPASTTLAAALKTEGVDASEERAGLLFPAACKARVKCGDFSSAEACEEQLHADWATQATAGTNSACRDASLDLLACATQAPSCAMPTSCMSLVQASTRLCLAGPTQN